MISFCTDLNFKNTRLLNYYHVVIKTVNEHVIKIDFIYFKAIIYKFGENVFNAKNQNNSNCTL